MSGYVCGLCDGANGPAVQINTSLANGQTIALCAADLPVGLIGGLATELGVDAQRLYDTVSKWVAREQKRLEAANAELQPAWDAADAARDPNTEYGQDDAAQLEERLAAEAGADA